MVVVKACKDEHTYQKGDRGWPANSSLSFSLENQVPTSGFYLIVVGLYKENLGVVIDLVTSPRFVEISEF